MLSLDKKILDPNSAVAKRMIGYGQQEKMFIVIPDREKRSVALSPTVQVETSGGGSKIVQLCRMYRVAKKHIKKATVEGITAQDTFFLGALALNLGAKFKIPVEIQIHGDFFSSPYYRRSGWITKMCIAHFTVQQADRIRVVGERVRQSVLRLGIPPERISVQPIKVDAQAIQLYQPRLNVHEQFPERKKIFLVLGRHDPVKNISWLLDIFMEARKNRPDIGLIVVGDGPERQRLTECIKSLNLERSVRLIGWTDDPWSYIKTADCLLFPSLSESYGLVAMEAAAAGTPVIMNDVGVANYELKPGPKVTILPINDRERWKKAVINSL